MMSEFIITVHCQIRIVIHAMIMYSFLGAVSVAFDVILSFGKVGVS